MFLKVATSKRRAPAIRVIATALGLTLAVSAGGASADWTLCVGDDGHTTLELAHAGSDCLTEDRRHHPKRSAPDMGGPSHHGCRDVPLVEGDSGHVSSQRQALAPAIAAWHVGAPRLPQRTTLAPLNVFKSCNNTLLCRHSVVLIV